MASCSSGNNGIIVNAKNLPKACADPSTITHLLNTVFVIMGAITFLFMVIAGMRLVISRGEPSKLADVRRQILYSFLGLLVIGAASAIVNLVIDKAT